MIIDELKELLRVQLPPMGPLAEIRGLIVAPDVWAQLAAEVPRTDDAPVFGWTVIVDKWLEPGTIIPVDKDGKPIARPPMTAPKRSETT